MRKLATPMNPRVTVLMPMFNGAHHVRAAIDSVLGQTFAEFELLVVDDASSDDSVAIVESYADPRIRLLQNPENLGQVGTTNRGLREARGEYVARLDQDDVALPARLQRQVAVLDSEPQVAVVGSWVDYVDEHGRTTETVRRPIDDLPELLFLLLIKGLPLAHSAVMYRRDLVLELGGYDEAARLAEDTDLWRRLALSRHEARVVPEVLLRYLVHTGQQSHHRRDEQREHNRVSYVRFAESLADPEAAEAGWLLDTLDVELPADGGAYTAALERLLEGARTHLALDVDAADKLDALLRRHVFRMARRSWRAGEQRESARALAAWAARNATPVDRALLRATRPTQRLLRLGRLLRGEIRNRRGYDGPHD